MRTTKFILAALLLVAGASNNGWAAKKSKPNEIEVTFQTNVESKHCKMRVEKVLPFEKGVKDLDIKIPAGIVSVLYDSTETNVGNIQQVLKKLGYTSEVIKPEAKAPAKDKK
jgi:copper chaperone CopZ